MDDTVRTRPGYAEIDYANYAIGIVYVARSEVEQQTSQEQVGALLDAKMSILRQMLEDRIREKGFTPGEDRPHS